MDGNQSWTHLGEYLIWDTQMGEVLETGWYVALESGENLMIEDEHRIGSRVGDSYVVLEVKTYVTFDDGKVAHTLDETDVEVGDELEISSKKRTVTDVNQVVRLGRSTYEPVRGQIPTLAELLNALWEAA